MTLPIVAAGESEDSTLPGAGDTIKLIVGEAASYIRIGEVVDVTRLDNGIVILDVLAECEACSDDPAAK